jgi:hypothetical protein
MSRSNGFRRAMLLAIASGFPFILNQARGQTYIGQLDGTFISSTFELGSTVSLPDYGWSDYSGTARIFDSAGGNGALIDGTRYGNYQVTYDTGVAIEPNTTYTLSFDMGWIGNGTAGSSTVDYIAQLGTLNTGSYTGLSIAQGGGVTYAGNMSQSIFSGSAQLTYTTGSSVSGDYVSVLLGQVSTDSGVDNFGFDNVKLSATPVPEPGAGLICGVGLMVLALRFYQRRKTVATA